jgi:hypothetical protein
VEQIGETLSCGFSQWSPGLGDNHVMGWVTVAIYLAAAIASAQTALALHPTAERRERRFWWIAFSILLFLALNKQLDLQSLLTMIARCHASLAGWYDDRRAVQRIFILAVAGGGVLVLGLLGLLLRGILERVWPALLGLGFVCGFVIIRAASFHHMDGLIGSSAWGMKVNWLLEVPGPLLVLTVALRRRKRVLGT